MEEFSIKTDDLISQLIPTVAPCAKKTPFLKNEFAPIKQFIEIIAGVLIITL